MSTKSTGIGDNLYVGGYDLSNDTTALSKISASIAMLDVTGINKGAHERIFGLRDGAIDVTTAFNPAANQQHVVLSALPRTDTQLMWTRGTAIGNAAACMASKQVDYNPTRGTDGALSTSVSTQANGFALEFCEQLTAGLRTDTAATNGTAWDYAASTSFGFQAYLQVTGFTGTDVTVKLQDSADNTTFADIASGAFAQTTAAHTFQRIAVGGTATVRRYVRAVTVTSGGFTSVTFAVTFVKNVVAVVTF